MRIPTRDIPQADELSDVLEVVDAVATGSLTYQELADAVGKVERQGRYYRRAAEILGLIVSAGHNRSSLSALGREYVSVSGVKKNEIVLQAVLNARIFQRIVPFLESKMPAGCTADEFKTFLDGVTEATGRTMMPRRANTLLGWLKSVGMVEIAHGRYSLCPLPTSAGVIRFVDEKEPLLPTTFSLREYEEVEAKYTAAGTTTSYEVDETKKERALESHRLLTNLVARRIRAAGSVPRFNGLVDLAARICGVPYIFEIKSTDEKNTRAQVRRGISQLYEYRYLQNVPHAQLVLVVEKPLSKELAWMSQYLVQDRGISLVWDGDMKHLHCCKSQSKSLEFLIS